MSITFRCPCGAVHTVDDAQVGVLFHCEACGLDLPVPAASTVPDAAPGAPSSESDAAESFARLVEAEHPHADAGELAEVVDPGHVHAHAKEELATVAHEVDPAHQGSAADLVAQMRAARAGLPAPDLGDLAAGTRPAARLARPRPMTAHQRASHHIGFKRFMWKPVLVMGVVCALFGLFCVQRFVMSGRAPAPPPRPASLPEGFSGQPLINTQGRPLKDAQGRDLFVGGRIIKDEKGREVFVKLSVPEKKQVLRDKQGELWLVDLDADAIVWQGDTPTATSGGFDIPVVRAEEDEDYAAFLDAENPQRHVPSQSLGYLGFAAAFLLIGPALLVLAVWMRRHVALVGGVAAPGVEPASAPGATLAGQAPGTATGRAVAGCRGLTAGGPVPAPGAAPASDAALEPEIIDAELADAPESPAPDSEPTPHA